MPTAPDHPYEVARQNTLDQLLLTGDKSEESFDRLTRLIRYVMGVSVAAFTVVDRDRLYLKSVQGVDVREIPRSAAFCAHTILQDEILVVPDTSKDARFMHNPLVIGEPSFRFYAGITVRAHNGLPIGTLCAIDPYPRELMAEQRQLLLDLRDILEESLLLRTLSVKDHQTGLFNRRYFDEFLEREWNRAHRNALPLSVLLVDVDHLKDGDDDHQEQPSLNLLAHHLRMQLRRGGDMLAHHGSQRFGIVLPDTLAADAVGVAAHLRASVQKLAIPNPASPDGIITVSMGVATVISKEDYQRGQLSLTARADAALQQAKRSGHNLIQMC